MLNYLCFTLVSTLNLTPSATDATGRDGRKTLGFYRLVRLVTSCPSFLVLKYRKIFSFSAFDLCFPATAMIGCAGRNFLSLDRFLLSRGVCCVHLCCLTMNMCRPLLDGFCVCRPLLGVLNLIGNWYD